MRSRSSRARRSRPADRRPGDDDGRDEAHSGADAIELVRRTAPDLVLLDIYMPDRLRDPEQEDIDHVFSLLRAHGRKSLPKGISAPTLATVVDALKSSADEVTSVEISERAGVSRGTARRYLEYLAATGAAELSLRYGSTGRPEHLYRWAAGSPSVRS